MGEPLKYITFADATEIVGLSPTQVRKHIKAGDIRTTAEGGDLLLAWQDVCKLVRQQRPPWSVLTEDLLDGSVDTEPVLLHADNVGGEQEFEVNRLVHGHCVDWLRRMPTGSVQTVVTSPPYWGVRRYKGEQEVQWSDGMTCALGAEPTPEDYVRHTMEIFRHLKRVLRDDGVIWWNIGDTYQTRTHIREGSVERLHALTGKRQDGWKSYPHKRYSAGHAYLKDKDLTMVPFQVAIGAQHLGFWVRSVIVWSKENTVPESVKDRPTTSHEYIFMLVKSRFYRYHARHGSELASSTNWAPEGMAGDQRNWRTVWKFPTVGSEKGHHTAAFPEELPFRCITVSSDPGDLVFDPFAGSGTTLRVAQRLGRQYFGCDLSEEYLAEARLRLAHPEAERSLEDVAASADDDAVNVANNGHLEQQVLLPIELDS